MRAATICLLLVLSAILLSGHEADGFFFNRDKVKNAVRRAGRWVRDNCSVGLGGVACKGIRLLRKRRSTETADKTDQPPPATLDQLCPQFDVGPNAKMAEVVDTALMEMDGNKDGNMNSDESVRFTELMGVIDYCSEPRKMQ